MIATTNAAALVKGAAAAAPKVTKVEVTRAFCMQGERFEIGAELELPDPLARQLVSDGKAVQCTEKPATVKSASSTAAADKAKPTTKGP